MLLFASQLNADRPTHRPRQQHRIGANVVGAVAPVTAGGLHADDLDALLRAFQQPGKVGAQEVRVLGAGPDLNLVVTVVGQGAGRTDGGMQLVGPEVGPAQALAGRRQAALDIAPVQHGALDARIVANGLGHITQVGQLLRPGFPFHPQLAGRLDRLLFTLGDHAYEVADHHHRDHAGDMGDGGFVHRQEAVADEFAAVVAGVGRAHDPPMEHARQAHVVDIGQFAGGLGRDIHPRRATPHQPILIEGLQRRLAGDAQLVALVAHQVGEGQALAVAGNHLALLHSQLAHFHAEALCRLPQQEAPRLGGGIAQGNGGDLEGGAGDGGALVGCPFGIAEHHADLIHAQVQLLGDYLRQGGADAGAEVHMAIEGIDLAVVAADGDEERQLAGLLHGLLALGHGPGWRLDFIDDEQDTGLGQQLVTGGKLQGLVHGRAPGRQASRPAARITARRISTWVPQRQRLPDSSLRICSSLGCGLRSSRALAVMIMPFMQ
ncbi:hypothetical protein D3C84_594420 [compost metagenome]